MTQLNENRLFGHHFETVRHFLFIFFGIMASGGKLVSLERGSMVGHQRATGVKIP